MIIIETPVTHETRLQTHLTFVDALFEDNISLIIYGNKIAHLDHTTGTAVTITSPSIARFQEKIFKMLWRKL